MLLSSLRAQLLASEAEVARLRSENARLQHEALQRELTAAANNNDVPVPAATATATAAASAPRLRASSIAGVSALCSLKRPPSSERIAGSDDIGNDNNGADNNGADNNGAAAASAVAAAPAPAAPGHGGHGGSLCLIPGCSEPSEGERSSHLCRGHHGQLRSATGDTNISPRKESGDRKPQGQSSSGSPEAKKQKKKKKKAAPTPARSSKKRRDGDKPKAKVDDASAGAAAAAAAAASPNTSTADLSAGGATLNLDLEGEKLTRSQRRLLESMMREDSNTAARANGVNSTGSQERTKARKKASAKPKGDTTTRAGNDSPTRSTKRRITKPNRPGFGETKEGRGSDYARIFIRQTLLETLRKVGTAVDPYGFFSSPVDPIADCPDYYDVVDRETEAMDLGSIESMIKDGTIGTVDEMRAMLMRIVYSCRKYNRDEDDEVRQEGEKILPLSEPFLDRARRAIEQQMKKSGCVETGEGAVHDTNSSSSVSSPRAEKRQRTEGGTKTQQGKQGRGARTNDRSKTASGPIQVFDRPAPDIGSGWRIIGIQRCRGKYPEHVDKYWISPEAKKRLRSRKEVSRFLAALDKTEGSEEEAFRMIQR